MPQPLTVELFEKPSALLILLKGEASIAGAAEMEKRLLSVVARKPRLLVIDMSGVTIISSIAISVLTQLHRGVSNRGGEVVIAGATGIVQDSMVRARLNRLFRFAASADEALSSAGTAQ
jgi:anti-anti-sigma factor